jgi:hypothetical protein
MIGVLNMSVERNAADADTICDDSAIGMAAYPCY